MNGGWQKIKQYTWARRYHQWSLNFEIYFTDISMYLYYSKALKIYQESEKGEQVQMDKQLSSKRFDFKIRLFLAFFYNCITVRKVKLRQEDMIKQVSILIYISYWYFIVVILMYRSYRTYMMEEMVAGKRRKMKHGQKESMSFKISIFMLFLYTYTKVTVLTYQKTNGYW